MATKRLIYSRVVVPVLGMITALGLAVVLASPAQAAWGGTVYNELSSDKTMKIARFESSGSGRCPIWNENADNAWREVTWNCSHYWLPSGQASHDVLGWWSDTDGFMIEQDYAVRWWWGTPRRIPAGKYTRFHTHQEVSCDENRTYGVLCTITLN